MNKIPIRNVESVPIRSRHERSELCSLDRHSLRLGAAGWPVDEDRADHQAGDQARVITEQIGADDRRDDEHQRPRHGL